MDIGDQGQGPSALVGAVVEDDRAGFGDPDARAGDDSTDLVEARHG